MYQVFNVQTGKATTKAYADWNFARRWIDRAVNTSAKRLVLGVVTVEEARALFIIKEV